MYNKSVKEVLVNVSSTQRGLTDAEAEIRHRRDGVNKLDSAKKQSFFIKFLSQFKNLMIIILILAGIISVVVGIVEKTSSEIIEACVIFAIVIINALIGVLQENKAEKALETLNKMSEPYCKVIRDGVLKKIKTEQLVVGDIVVLEAGDIVPADGRLINCAKLKVEESALTGESLPVNKHTETILAEDVPLGDRKNMVYSGSVVSYGRGEFVVTATGMKTEIGKIASMLQSKKEETPLDKKLKNLSRVLTIAIGVICVIVFLVMLLTKQGTVINAFMTGIVLAVAAIPEGLPAVVTIVMALGVTKLSKKNAIIRKLSAVETLGSTQVICSDKTGTLTLNKMTVKEAQTFKNKLDKTVKTSDEELLIKAMVLCNDSMLDEVDGASNKYYGDPTETALVDYALDLGIVKTDYDNKFVRVDEVPFDSVRKMMSTVNLVAGDKLVFTKGGIDEVLSKCAYVLDGEKVRKLTDTDRHIIIDRGNALSDRALRVLAYAYKKLEAGSEIESDLIFVGITGMIDPARVEVKDSVASCKAAGIKVVMITGDHIKTAAAIAKEIGILGANDLVISGKELDALSDKEFLEKINDISVYARVSPENKVRIVKAFKSLGKIVAMTGDGVNDAPSLKAADIGVGMGITGTDVTKGVADMVLADDNFATIETAVKEGRKIYANIQKAISFLISSNICEVLSLFIVTLLAVIIKGPELVFLAPVQLLWVNLVTDTFPAIAFSNCPAERNAMKVPPRKNQKSLFSGRVGIDILVSGVLQTLIVLSAFFLADYLFDNNVASTITLLVLNMTQLFHSINVAAGDELWCFGNLIRFVKAKKNGTQKEEFATHPLKNLALVGSFFLGLVLTLAIIYIPGVNSIFSCVGLTIGQLGIAFGMSFLIVVLFELYKLIFNLVKKGREKKGTEKK